MKAINKKSTVEIYYEWLNDWLTTERMAEYYNISRCKLEKLIETGRNEYLKKNESIEYCKFWGIN